jgi:hypothetical protein
MENLYSFLAGFFYGCAAMCSMVVMACIVVGYVNARKGSVEVGEHDKVE